MSWATRFAWWAAAAVVSVASLGLVGLTVTDGLAWHSSPLDRRASLDGVTRVELDVEMLAVDLVGSKRNEIRVTGTIRSGLNRPTLDVERRGDTLQVRVRCSSRPINLGLCSGSMQVALPDTPAVVVETDLGDIRARRLSNLRVELSSDIGDVSASWSRTPHFVAVRADAGDVHLGLPDVVGGYAVTTTGASGSDISRVQVRANSNRTVEVQSDLGTVLISEPF